MGVGRAVTDSTLLASTHDSSIAGAACSCASTRSSLLTVPPVAHGGEELKAGLHRMWKSVVEPETPDTPRVGPWPVGHPACVFLFFSSRLGCLGSLVLSVLLTLLLLWIFRVI